MKYRKTLCFLVLVLIFPGVGCVRVDAANNAPTFGEQIFDLVEAHDSGLISDEEFQLLRRKLIRSMGR